MKKNTALNYYVFRFLNENLLDVIWIGPMRRLWREREPNNPHGSQIDSFEMIVWSHNVRFG